MEKIKNIIGNTPMVLGLGVLQVALLIKKIADKLFDISFMTHVAIDTEVGKKIRLIKEQMKKHVEAMKAAQGAGQQDDGKLARVFNKDLPNGVFQIGKKPTTDN